VKEASVNLLQLNPVEVATQLMVEDFTIFRQVSVLNNVLSPSLTQQRNKLERLSLTSFYFPYESNRTARIRHQWWKTAVLGCHRCLIDTGVEKLNNI
jgi:hypothetical protein